MFFCYQATLGDFSHVNFRYIYKRNVWGPKLLLWGTGPPTTQRIVERIRYNCHTSSFWDAEAATHPTPGDTDRCSSGKSWHMKGELHLIIHRNFDVCLTHIHTWGDFSTLGFQWQTSGCCPLQHLSTSLTGKCWNSLSAAVPPVACDSDSRSFKTHFCLGLFQGCF